MRNSWTDNEVDRRVHEARSLLSLERMPTASELRTLKNGNALAVAVSRRGGFDGVADRLGLVRAEHDSRKGWRWEAWVAGQARLRGFEVVERSRVKEVADLVINGKTVDVKGANGARYGSGVQWTWRTSNVGRVGFYVLLALLDGEPPVVFVAPGSGVSTTSVTARRGLRGWGRHRVWLDGWDRLR